MQYNLQDINNPSYNSSQTSAISQFATLQPDAKPLPDWLKTNPDDLIGELHQMYGQIPNLTSTAGTKKAYGDAISTTQGMGGQIANNAMNEAVNRAGITGGQINSSMVKAQAMLPVYDTTNKLKTDEASAVAGIQQNHAQLMTSIAQTMGQLRTGYLSSLGQINNQRQGQTDLFTTQQQQQRFNQQQADRNYTMSLQQLAQRSSQAAGAGGQTTPGYIPNSGPVQDSFVNGIRQNNTVSVGMSANANMGRMGNIDTTPKGPVPQTANQYNAMQSWLQDNQNNRNQPGYSMLYGG